MGLKVNPVSLRLGIVKTWESQWFAGKKKYADYLLQDYNLREYIKKRLQNAGISRIKIERSAKEVRLQILTARPGVVIGRKGSEIELLKKDIEKNFSEQVKIDIKEVKRPELDAQLIAEDVSLQLSRRIAFRRAMKRCVSSAMRFGAKGVKIICSGRLGGAEMARTAWYKEGRIPLHTLRADIDYGFTKASTTYGVIGVKAFVFKGEILSGEKQKIGRNRQK